MRSILIFYYKTVYAELLLQRLVASTCLGWYKRGRRSRRDSPVSDWWSSETTKWLKEKDDTIKGPFKSRRPVTALLSSVYRGFSPPATLVLCRSLARFPLSVELHGRRSNRFLSSASVQPRAIEVVTSAEKDVYHYRTCPPLLWLLTTLSCLGGFESHRV